MDKSKKRNIGLDFLRILSMLMIVMGHFLNHSNILSEINISFNYLLGLWLKMICAVAVDCYFLISGYFLLTSKFRLSKVLLLWGEALFWSVSIFAVMVCFVKVNITHMLYSFLPISMKEYWFITVYIALYAFAPFFKALISKLSKFQFRVLLCILIIIFSVWKMIVPMSGTLDNTGSMGLPIAIMMWFIGAYIRKYNVSVKYGQRKVCIFICFLIPVIQCISYLLIESLIARYVWLGDYLTSDILLYNTYILIIIYAVFCMLIFKDIDINNKFMRSIICSISPLTLGVYLIHEQFVLR